MPKKKSTESSKPKHPGGRPTDYTPELGEKICIAISTIGRGLQTICDMHDHFPKNAKTIHEWVIKHEEFSKSYMRAKRMQAHVLADDSLDIADNSERDTIVNERGKKLCDNEWVQRSRLRVEQRRWYAGRLEPLYGDRLRVDEDTGLTDKLKEELVGLKKKLDKKNKKEY